MDKFKNWENPSTDTRFYSAGKNNMALLSVIIINYNTFDYTCNCIKSVYDYTMNVPFEIILVDNASTECNPKLFKEKFPDLKLIYSDINLGFAKGNNLGIQHCSGDFILLLNSDTELVEDSLSACFEYASSLKYPVALTCKLIYPDNSVQYQCSRFPGVLLNLIELFRLHKLLSKQKRGKLLLSTYYNHEEMIEPEWIWGAFFMFNKSILSNLPDKKLDESFFMYCEDMQWCFDFRKAGVKILYFPFTKVVHHVGASSGMQQKIDNICKNELLFVQKTKGRIYKYIYALVRILNLRSSYTLSGKSIAMGLLKNI